MDCWCIPQAMQFFLIHGEGQGFYIDLEDNCPIKFSCATKTVINSWHETEE